MTDDFLLSYASFDEKNQPFIDIETDQVIKRLPILGQNLSLDFETTTKYCAGWVDFENKCAQSCPDRAEVNKKYNNCARCNEKTGFNPAFYYAKTVSSQQTKINSRPHFVYIAYFAPDLMKVGITQESRGIRRLLEQGARMALKLETFPTANIARQYEEKIARQLDIAETVSNNKKIQLIKSSFEPGNVRQKLEESKGEIENVLSVTFPNAELIETDKYFYTQDLDITKAIHLPYLKQLVGKAVAMVGTILITDYNSSLLAYNLKSFVGYRASRLSTQPDISLPSEQLALF